MTTDGVGTEYGARRVAELTEQVRREVAESVTRAGVEVGRLVADAELYFDDAVDVLEQLARQLGVPDAGTLVLDAIGQGMADEVTEDVSCEPTTAPTPPQPAPAPQALREPFRNADECAAAVLAWASERLVVAPDARTASADLARSWAGFDGRSLVGFGSIIEAVLGWGQVAGVAVDRYRDARRRGLTGLRLAASDVPAAGVTTTDDAAGPDVTPRAPEPIQQRAPSGGRWQTIDDLAGADATSGGWFTVG